MYKRTMIMTLPPESTTEHWVFPTDHCEKINSIWTKRIYGERFYSDDGKILTTINIWESKDAYQDFADHPESSNVHQSLRQWAQDHGCTIEVKEEEI